MTLIKSVATHKAGETTIEISIVQLARKRTLMRSLEQGEYKLQAPPTDKMRIRDAPRMECASLKKMYNRSALAEAVRASTTLRAVSQAEIRDRSAPFIEDGVHIKFSERRAFLNALLLQVEQFYLRVLTTVSHIHHTSLETAIYVRENAPAKIHDIVESGQHKVHDLYEAGRDTAASAVPKASNLIGSGKSKINTLASKAKDEIKLNAQGILDGSVELVDEAEDVVKEASANAAELFSEGGAAIKGAASDVASFASRKASSIADKFNALLSKSKNLLASDEPEILLRKRRPLRRATSEAAIYRAYSELLLEVEQNRQNLNHVLLSEIRDRSKPFIQSPQARQQNLTKQTLAYRGAVLSEIKRSATCMTLNHVSVRDTTRPVVPPTLRNLQSDARKKLAAEIESADLSTLLRPSAVPTSDRSAPLLPFGNSVQLDKFESTKKSMLQQVQAGVDLAPFSPRLMKDRSAPMVLTGSPGLSSM